MIYLVVDKDGTEKASNGCCFRADEALNILISENEKYSMYRKKCSGVWADDYSDGYFNVPKFSGVKLPKGTIRKLIGFDLTWSNEPHKVD